MPRYNVPRGLSVLFPTCVAALRSNEDDLVRRGADLLTLGFFSDSRKLHLNGRDGTLCALALDEAMRRMDGDGPATPLSRRVLRSGAALSRKLRRMKPARPRKPPAPNLGPCGGYICGNPATERCRECSAPRCWIHNHRVNERDPYASFCDECMKRLGLTRMR